MPESTNHADSAGARPALAETDTKADTETGTDVGTGPIINSDSANRQAAKWEAALARLRGLPRKWLWALGLLATVGVAAAGATLVVSREAPRVIELDLGGPLVYHDFPDVIADLKSEGRTPRYVKLGIVVELPEGLREGLELSQTEIVDALHGYLRERTREDLMGEAGAARVRAQLTAMIDAAIAPGRIKSVLFRQFILN